MYDFHRMMEASGGATKLKCSEFADAIIKHMGPGVGGSHSEGRPVAQMARA